MRAASQDFSLRCRCLAVGVSTSFVPSPENPAPSFWRRAEEGELARSQETRGHRGCSQVQLGAAGQRGALRPPRVQKGLRVLP